MVGRPVLVLPKRIQTELKLAARLDDRHVLDSLLREIAEKGWGYQPSATALGLSRQTVFERAQRGSLGLPGLPEVPLAREPRPEPPELTQDEKERLSQLQEQAVQLRGFHKDDDPLRKASEELSALIDELTQRKITYAQIGEVLQVEPMTVRARLRRHGYRTTEPSLRRYRAAVQEEIRS